MATSPTTIAHFLDQMSGAGTITAKKMFGEFGIYCDGVLVALACDNELFVKPTDAGRTYAGAVPEGPAYPGAKPSLRVTERIDDREWIAELVRVTKRALADTLIGKTRASAAPR